jgi:hypothetical protein
MHAQDFVMVCLVLLAIYLWNRWAVNEAQKERAKASNRRYGVIPALDWDPDDTQTQDVL